MAITNVVELHDAVAVADVQIFTDVASSVPPEYALSFAKTEIVCDAPNAPVEVSFAKIGNPTTVGV